MESKFFFILAAIILAYCLPFFHLRRWAKLTALESALLAPGAASLAFGAAAFITHAFGLNQRVIHAVVLAALAVSAVPQLARAARGGAGSYRRPVLVSASFLALIFLDRNFGQPCLPASLIIPILRARCLGDILPPFLPFFCSLFCCSGCAGETCRIPWTRGEGAGIFLCFTGWRSPVFSAG